MSRGNKPFPLPDPGAGTMELRDRGTAFTLDASALLAMLQGEPGGEMVELVLEHSVMSTVNWSEVVQKSLARGVPVEGMRQEVEALGLRFEPFTTEDGEQAAAFREPTRKLGLSLGDRACLALGYRLGLPVLTADRLWAQTDLAWVQVELLR